MGYKIHFGKSIFISADPTGLGVSEPMVHPVPPNSPNAQTAHILRFSDSQILWILRFVRFLRFSRFSDSQSDCWNQIIYIGDRAAVLDPVTALFNVIMLHTYIHTYIWDYAYQPA